MPPVTGRSITVSYGSVDALADVSFRLEPGTATALIGPNGSGKTTLLHVLAGLLDPSAGAVDRGGRTVALVPQMARYHEWMPLTVDEVVTMGRYRARGLLGPLRTADREIVAGVCDRLAVTDLRTRQFGELSGGQRQRVLVAQALALEADLLLLDEPVTGLDMPSQRRILDIVATEASAGTIVVLSTHHLDEARRADQVLLLASRLIAGGTPDEALTVPNLQAAYGGQQLGPELFDEHAHGSDDGAVGPL